MTFFEHLVELRKRLINSLIAIGIGAFVGVYISKYVIRFVNEPMLGALKASGLPQHLIYTHPAGGFNLLITLGVYIGRGAGIAGGAVPDLVVRGACACTSMSAARSADFCFRRCFSSWPGSLLDISSPCLTC